MSLHQTYWSSLLDLLICGYVRISQNTYAFRMNISTDIASIIFKFHPNIPESESNSIFTAKRIKYYGKHQLTESKATGIASIAWNDKTVVTIDVSYCVGIHHWNCNKFSIEKKRVINKILQKFKTKVKIGDSDMSTKITNKHLCFQITNDCSYIFAAGYEDNSFIIWDIEESKSVQCIRKHQNIVSCLALDTNTLVTGSYDKSLMIWNINHDTNNKTLTIQQPATHILDKQLAPVICVDISLKAGLIACCLLNGIIKIYNSRTIEQISAHNTYIANQHVYFTYSYFKPTLLRISDAFGHIICHSQETETLFMLSSTGILIHQINTNGNIYYDIQVSKCGQYIICGGEEGIMRVKELSSFKTKKKFHHSTQPVRCIFLDKSQRFVLSALCDGHVMVSSVAPKNTCNTATLFEIGYVQSM